MPITNDGVLLDSSIVIHHFRHGSDLEPLLDRYGKLYLPYVAFAELCSGAFRTLKPETGLLQIERFLPMVVMVLPNARTALYYGLISARMSKAGTPIPQNDVWIAALAIQFNLPLATLDDHFTRVQGLTLAAR